MIKVLLLILLAVTLANCSGKKKPELTAEQYYEKGTKSLTKGNLREAKESFSAIDINYPYSELAAKGEIMTAFVNYVDKEYIDSLHAADKFIKLHPASADVDYMYYLKAISYYQQMNDFHRDQIATEEAKKSLREIIARFPEGKYAQDSSKKLIRVDNKLAANQLNIGRFYQLNEDYLSSAKRFKKVTLDYDGTKHAPEAYYRLAASYTALGLTKEAKLYKDFLLAKYPESIWNKFAQQLPDSVSNATKTTY
jgi:outer membrane protein assembly factor BamD